MKIVLLPGMGGTGRLFGAFSSALDERLVARIISYPERECLGYGVLEARVRERLPAEDFVLLGESFSAPIACRIAIDPPPDLRAVIFVGGFLQPPRPKLMRLSRLLPRTALFALPAPSLILQTFLVGRGADASLRDEIKALARSLPPEVLTFRLDEIAGLRAPDKTSAVPAFYLRGNQDRLVPASCVDPFRKTFDNLTVLPIDGPHFILQSRPARSANMIIEALTAQKILQRADQ